MLDTEEVHKILNASSNIKHKAILMFIYSVGLRVGDVAKFRLEDIDPKRGLIHIKGSKGWKDRCTILSQTTIEINLRNLPRILIIFRYIQNNAYMNKLNEMPAVVLEEKFKISNAISFRS